MPEELAIKILFKSISMVTIIPLVKTTSRFRLEGTFCALITLNSPVVVPPPPPPPPPPPSSQVEHNTVEVFLGVWVVVTWFWANNGAEKISSRLTKGVLRMNSLLFRCQ